MSSYLIVGFDGHNVFGVHVLLGVMFLDFDFGIFKCLFDLFNLCFAIHVVTNIDTQLFANSKTNSRFNLMTKKKSKSSYKGSGLTKGRLISNFPFGSSNSSIYVTNEKIRLTVL